MNIYAIEATGHYGGGMAIVAANSGEEAIRTALTIDSGCYADYRSPDKVTKLQATIETNTSHVLIFHENYE